ncbi:MAG: hypothetical protein WD771_08760 [Gemmatimonadaceae bacterium]
MTSDLLNYGFAEQRITQFQSALRESGQLSADAFLELRPEFSSIGKLAIARALIPYEHSAHLFERDAPHLYDLIWKALKAPVKQFGENRLTIVTFNYDRSFEHYLCQVAHHSFNARGSELQELVSCVPVHHVYGSLGSLTQRAYDARVDAVLVNVAAESLRVMNERIETDPELTEAQAALEDAQRVLFLGFGYDELNLQRLQCGKWASTTETLGSAFGLLDRERQRVLDTLRGARLASAGDDCVVTLRRLAHLED